MENVTILGSTGSIGKSTLDVLAMYPEDYAVFALTAFKSVTALIAQCIAFKPRYAVIDSEEDAVSLRTALASEGIATEVLSGVEALEAVSSDAEVDVVMAAIVGAAGLRPTMAAVRTGKKVLLANKESLVMGGQLFTRAVELHEACLLPVDSEHNAIFQCLPAQYGSLSDAGVEKILLTGSGGPFRERELASLSEVSPEEACAHPNWSMGKKISVDSATMMNKGLEYIEACWMFSAREDQIEVLIHPQSVVHSMVQYSDGSVLAQLGRPDMRTPIAHTLAWPRRIGSGVEALDFTRLVNLSFEAPDYERFPCLRAAMDVMSSGKDYAVALNAANEVAVDMFLQGKLAFTGIHRVINSVLDNWRPSEPDSIDAVIDADIRARVEASALISR